MLIKKRYLILKTFRVEGYYDCVDTEYYEKRSLRYGTTDNGSHKICLTYRAFTGNDRLLCKANHPLYTRSGRLYH